MVAGVDRWVLTLGDAKTKAVLLAASPGRTAGVDALEEAVLRRADLVWAITPEDASKIGVLAQPPRQPEQPKELAQAQEEEQAQWQQSGQAAVRGGDEEVGRVVTGGRVFLLPVTLAEAPAGEAPGASSFRGFKERAGFLFVGTGQNPTNVAACRWFLRDVWPRLRRAVTGAHLTIAGAPPPGGSWDSAGALATNEGQRAAGVRVTGFTKVRGSKGRSTASSLCVCCCF